MKLFIWEMQISSILTADPKHQQDLNLDFEFTSHNAHISFCKVPPFSVPLFQGAQFQVPWSSDSRGSPQIGSISNKWNCTSKHRSIQKSFIAFAKHVSPLPQWEKQLLNNYFTVTTLPPMTSQGLCSKANRSIHVSRIKLVFLINIVHLMGLTQLSGLVLCNQLFSDL